MKCPDCKNLASQEPSLLPSAEHKNLASQEPSSSSAARSKEAMPIGEVIVRKTKRGKTFYGCSRYPKCKWASWTDPRKEGKKQESDKSAQ